jgi:hypothetical protein
MGGRVASAADATERGFAANVLDHHTEGLEQLHLDMFRRVLRQHVLELGQHLAFEEHTVVQ